MAAITGQCPNVETNEGFYPILYLYRRETKDSGGAGEFRGGMGATSCWIPYGTDGRPIQLVLATFGEAFPTALGVDGGYPANTAMYKMARGAAVQEWFARGEIPGDIAEAGGELQYLPEKCETRQEPDDVFEHTWSGGGGFGDPLDRDPEKVAADVRNDAVSPAAARDVYGVVLDGDGRWTQTRRRAGVRRSAPSVWPSTRARTTWPAAERSSTRSTTISRSTTATRSSAAAAATSCARPTRTSRRAPS
jgi:N-methylhydantoinase B